MSEPVANPMMASSGEEREPIGAAKESGGGGLRDESSFPWLATWILLVSLSAIISSGLVLWLRKEHGIFVPALAIAICLLAALFDAWTTRIPNALTYTAIIIGVIINILASALTRYHVDTATLWLAAPGLSLSMMGLGVCAGLGIVGLMVAQVGGGDIKLLAALGALLGLNQIGSIMIVALCVALVYSLINLALFGRLNSVARRSAFHILELIYLRRLELPEVQAQSETALKTPRLHGTIPMAVPLAIGLILSEALQIHTIMWGAT